MKTLLLITIFVLSILLSTHGQTDSLNFKKSYRTWIIPKDSRTGKILKERGNYLQGILFDVKDSSIIISKSMKSPDYLPGNFEVSEVDAGMIKTVKIRKKGALGTGVLIGGLTGACIGILIGVLQHTNGGTHFDQETQHAGLIVFPLLCTGLGVGIGAAIGGIKINFPIKGSQIQFDFYKAKLYDYSINQNFGLSGKSFSKLRDSVVDIDGNVYHTVALGGQVWMAENLLVTHYQDGSGIPGVSENIPGEGRKYNWFAVNNNLNLCPPGWHVPSLDKWTSLINSLGGVEAAANILEEDFSPKGKVSQWWSSNQQDSLHAQNIYLNNQTVGITITSSDKTTGLSVRCIRNY